jgi:hypothetical protein
MPSLWLNRRLEVRSLPSSNPSIKGSSGLQLTDPPLAINSASVIRLTLKYLQRVLDALGLAPMRHDDSLLCIQEFPLCCGDTLASGCSGACDVAPRIQ